MSNNAWRLLMLFCSVFWINKNIVRESHLIYGHNREEVYNSIRNVFVTLCEKAFENWYEYRTEIVDKLIEDGGEQYANGEGGVFIEWIQPENIHLTE